MNVAVERKFLRSDYMQLMIFFSSLIFYLAGQQALLWVMSKTVY